MNANKSTSALKTFMIVTLSIASLTLAGTGYEGLAMVTGSWVGMLIMS